jgi:3-oxoacyl-[acyl-carrier-protein] synthase II
MISSLANSLPETWTSILNLRSGVTRLTDKECPRISSCPVQIGGFVHTSFIDQYILNLSTWNSQYLSKRNALALGALDQAMDASKLSKKDLEGAGIISASGLSDVSKLLGEGEKQVFDYVPSLCTMISRYLATNNITANLSDPLSSGYSAIIYAYNLISEGLVNTAVVVASENVMDTKIISAFNSLGFLNTECNGMPEKAIRPFDANSKGTVLGDGSVVLILENRDHAENRRIKILGEIEGYSRATNAEFLTRPEEDGQTLAKVIKKSLNKNLQADVIVSEGLGLASYDLSEADAYNSVLPRAKITAFKPYIGHTLSASGLFNVAFGVKMLEEGYIPKVMNTEEPLKVKGKQPNVVNSALKMGVNRVVSSGLGLGGQNYSIVLSKV